MIEKRVSNKSQNTMGERTYKIDFNAIFSKVGGVITVHALDMQNIIFYPNGYMNINMNGEYTKHYYADALRIASKIGSGAQGLDLCNDAIVANNHYFTYDYLNERIMQQHDIMREELNEVVVPLQDIQNINPMPHPNFCSLGIGGYEPALFFYHPDHLGSTGMVTDNNANITQGFLYTPFGELLYEYSPGWQSGVIPKYSFNAKELDEENGMYYYSARYYAPPTFISRDPLFEKYPSISPYAYCANNPIILVDPTGMELGDPLKTMRVRRDATYHTFGYVRPYTKSGIHQGIDYYAPEGTPIIMVPFFRTTK